MASSNMQPLYSKWLDPSEEEEEEDDMSDEDELVELPGGLDQLEAIAEEYAKREEIWRFFLLLFATCLQCPHRFRIRSQSYFCIRQNALVLTH